MARLARVEVLRGLKRVSDYFDWLKSAIKQLSESDELLFQAFADAHRDDPLGGLTSKKSMTTSSRKRITLSTQRHPTPLT